MSLTCEKHQWCEEDQEQQEQEVHLVDDCDLEQR